MTSDDFNGPPSADTPLAPTIHEAFTDFATVGVPTILTLLDAIHDDDSVQLPNEMETILFGILGTYCHSLRSAFLQGFPPSLCHQVSTLEIMSNERVTMMIQTAMEFGTNEMIADKLGRGDNGEI